ncbi:hypothetical protein BWQ96_08190 [Gracilariopsis chorda]|uniref:Uncharacterized protein n=1 Tax=Gracilariopsis chorda TaxID=448386 RepID=A0A2V3IJ15_9FLOR|nr:hypothetical protein BWQ96_08190 [Gracilariopsis chorda]|eukprot:PXF42084.1 hypothetical protein BWQ96_08190 [Gracilariopsis chorda]
MAVLPPTVPRPTPRPPHRSPPNPPNVAWSGPPPSWQAVRDEILALARLQLLHDASARIAIEKTFASEELMLDSELVDRSIAILNSSPSAAPVLSNLYSLLSDVRDDFAALHGWRTEQIGDHLVGHLRGANSLEDVESITRRVLLGHHADLSALRLEVDRVRESTSIRWHKRQAFNRAQVEKIKPTLLSAAKLDVVLDDLARPLLADGIPTPNAHAICILAAMECGFRPTAESFLVDLYNTIRPDVERGRLLMLPLLPRSLRSALIPIFARQANSPVDGLLTGDRWLHWGSAHCRSADGFPIYTSCTQSRPQGRIMPLMWSDHIGFEADSYLSKFLRALYSGRDGGAFRTLHTHLSYSARTCCVPEGRVVSSSWALACNSWCARYGARLVANIKRVVSVRALAAIYAGGGGFVEFRNGFCERILSGVFTNKFEITTTGGRLSGIPEIGGSYRLVGEGTMDRRDVEVFTSLIHALDSRGIALELVGVQRIPMMYNSVNFIVEGTRTGAHDMWVKQSILLKLPGDSQETTKESR